MNNTPFFIDDMQESTRYIAGVANWFPSCRFTFREFGARERERVIVQINDEADKGHDGNPVAITAKLLAPRIVSWEACDASGNATEAAKGAPPSAASLERVDPRVRMRMRDIMLHIAPSDPDPLVNGDASHDGASEERDRLGN